MDTFQKDLWAHLELVPSLPVMTGRAVLAYLLELACQSQNALTIELGRKVLMALPRIWLLEHIEIAAEPLVQLNDEWEYRRLLELYSLLDTMLVRQLALRGINNPDTGIKEASRSFLEM
jgi:hypothetical protein